MTTDRNPVEHRASAAPGVNPGRGRRKQTINIFEILSAAGGVMTAAELSDLLGIPRRTVTREIRRERLYGLPICAQSRSAGGGYYVVENRSELETYIRRLNGRIDAIASMRDALQRIADSAGE